MSNANSTKRARQKLINSERREEKVELTNSVPPSKEGTVPLIYPTKTKPKFSFRNRNLENISTWPVGPMPRITSLNLPNTALIPTENKLSNGTGLMQSHHDLQDEYLEITAWRDFSKRQGPASLTTALLDDGLIVSTIRPKNTIVRFFRSVRGTMPAAQEKMWKTHKTLGVLDTFFRGFGQIAFMNNAICGALIFIAIIIENWEMAMYGAMGNFSSCGLALVLGFDEGTLKNGLFGYNGILVAMALFLFHDGEVFIPAFFCAGLSTIVMVGFIQCIFPRLSPFTIPFILVTWIWLLAAPLLSDAYPKIDGLDPHSFREGEWFEIWSSNDKWPPMMDIIHTVIAGLGQIFFMEGFVPGIIVLIAFFLYSCIMGLAALFSSILSVVICILLGIDPTMPVTGWWGYNPVLTGIVLCGIFFVASGWRIYILTILGVISTFIFHSAVAPIAMAMGLPVITLPFTVVSWLFILLSGTMPGLTKVELTMISTPEDHRKLARRRNFAFGQFKMLNNSSLRLVEHNLDSSIENLATVLSTFLLCSYAVKGEVNKLEMMLREGTYQYDPNIGDYDRRTPLHIAASWGQAEAVKTLLNFKADVNALDKNLQTPLWEAIENNHEQCCKILLAAGAIISENPTISSKLCTLASSQYPRDFDKLRWILTFGGNRKISTWADYDGRTALHLAVAENNEPAWKILLDAGASPYQRDNFGKSAFDEAKIQKRTRFVEFCSQTGFQMSKEPPKLTFKNKLARRIPRTKAKSFGKYLMLRPQFTNVPFADEEDWLYWSLFLNSAIEEKDFEECKYHIQMAKYNPLWPDKVYDYDKRSPFHLVSKSSVEILNLLISGLKGKLEILSLKDRWNHTPLLESCLEEREDIAGILRANKAQLGDVPAVLLCELAAEGKTAVLRLLLKRPEDHYATALNTEHGTSHSSVNVFNQYANPNAFDYDQRTPLHLAVANNRQETVKLLLDCKADPNKKDRWGKLPEQVRRTCVL